jgi:hypothetical protein
LTEQKGPSQKRMWDNAGTKSLEINSFSDRSHILVLVASSLLQRSTAAGAA